MDERVKLTVTALIAVLLISAESYFGYTYWDSTTELRAENDALKKDINALEDTINVKIPEAKKTLAKMKEDDVIFAQMVPDSREDLNMIDFIGAAQAATGIKVVNYAEEKKRVQTRRGPRADYETHKWTLKGTGLFREFITFLNYFEYHGFSEEQRRLYTVRSFTIANDAKESDAVGCAVEIEVYSMPEEKTAEGEGPQGAEKQGKPGTSGTGASESNN